MDTSPLPTVVHEQQQRLEAPDRYAERINVMASKIRFDVLVLAATAVEKEKQSAVGSLLTALNWKAPAKPTHWRVRVTKRPDEANALGLPLALGKEYDLSQELFNFGTFLGDHVEIEWDGTKYDQAKTFAHGYQPTRRVSSNADALVALRELHDETVVNATTDVPATEVAGRAVWAGHLLNRVMGEVSWRKNHPVGALAPASQVEAVKLAGAIFRRLGIDRIREVSKEYGGMAAACREMVELSLKRGVNDGSVVYDASWILQIGLMTFMPERRASQAEIDSIGNLLAMAAQADANYGKGTGDRVLDKVFGMGDGK